MRNPTKDKRTALLLVVRLLLSTSALAVDPPHQDEEILNTLHQMRLRQEEEENVVRVIQQPVVTQVRQVCSPVEQARQRLRDLAASKTRNIGDVTIEAGHGEVTVDGNSGTIDNSVNVQVVNPNDRFCP